MQIIQLLPTLSYGDAVGNDTRAIKEILVEMGYETQIYAENIDERLPQGTVLPVSEIPQLNDEDVILYHASTGTELNYQLPKFGGRKVMVYHNITPPEFFRPYSLAAAHLTQQGLDGVRYLADKVDYCIADSDYNREDLRRMGYTCPIDVCPILIPFSDYEKKPAAHILKQYENDGYINLLFVGRIAPNKKQEDIIRAFYAYHKLYNPKSRLMLVGSWSGMDLYYERLVKYVDQLGLGDHVVFTGHIKFDEILAYYSVADVLLCMSEHEGFCVPLVEAMYFDLPIVAFDCAAIPYTLGGSGMLIGEKDPRLAAAAVHRIFSNPELKEKIIIKQKDRLRDFSYEVVSSILIGQLKRFLNGAEANRS